MRIKSFKQFVRETIAAPSDPQDNTLLRLTVFHLIAAIEQHFDPDSLVTVRLNCPNPDSIAISFGPQEEARGGLAEGLRSVSSPIYSVLMR